MTQPVQEPPCRDCGWTPEPGALWPSEGGVAVRWIEKNLIQPTGDHYGKPLKLREDQKLFIWNWYSFCKSCGHWRYDEGLRGASTGDGKTTMIAALAVVEAFGPPQIAPVDPDVVSAACTWEQANRLFGAAGTMCGGKSAEVRESPLRGLFHVFESRIERADTVPGMIERVASVAGSNEGGLPSLFLADELHEWGVPGEGRARVHMVIGKSTKKRRLICRIPVNGGGFTEIERGPGRILNLSTAGSDLDSLLGSMYVFGKKAERDPQLAPKFLFDWREAADSLNFDSPEDRRTAVCQASAAAGVLWDAEARVREWDKPQVPHHEWSRYYGNRWVDVADDSWLRDHPAAWGKCQGSWTLLGDEQVVLAVDMSLKHDSTAVVECAKLADGRVAVTARIWQPAEGTVDHYEVFGYIRERAIELGPRLLGVVYDPRFFEVPARMLEADKVEVIQFDQTPVLMSPACGETFDAIVNGTIVHDGDSELARHVKAAVRRPQDRGYTLAKSKSKRRIDACIAMVMGYFTLIKAKPRKKIDWSATVW